ncbi:hypothetical protein IFM89_034117 [Coptis chinensis]|uniref:Stress response NST1-like protein n=1 Tax=Coptis chinensis TaxID=261450 RepID=A0A835I6J7_9MAGN|nr:hypothetical protein IFM89_034117 [Coptis chinensis]
MAAARKLVKQSSFPLLKSLFPQTYSRYMSTSRTPLHRDQEYSKPCEFLGSWAPSSKDPKEAEAKLAMLRRDYAKQVRELRKEYFYEMEFQRQEKQRKDEAKKEKMRVEKEERKAKKAALAKEKASERKVVDEEFRQTILKERAEKLEYWRLRERKVAEKKQEKKELLRRQSSNWVAETELEKKILEAVVVYTTL